MTLTTLKEHLATWRELDSTVFALARAIGLFDEDTPGREVTPVVWSSNRLGDSLYEMLTCLVNIGAVEYDAETLRYRWRDGFEWQTVARQVGK